MVLDDQPLSAMEACRTARCARGGSVARPSLLQRTVLDGLSRRQIQLQSEGF